MYRIQARGNYSKNTKWFNSRNAGTTEVFNTKKEAQEAINQQSDQDTIEYRIVTETEAKEYD